ncbi:MAG: beta-ketoacyl-[acyl-carrier-protein] synthase family protein [Candidatus Woesearchaeota archaeon]
MEHDCTPVVVGMGVISPAGKTVDEFADHIFNGIVGNIKEITRFDVSQYPVKIAGEVVIDASDSEAFMASMGKSDPTLRKAWRRFSTYTKYAVLAGMQAVGQVPGISHSALDEAGIISLLDSNSCSHEEKLKQVLQACNNIPVIIGSGYGGLEDILDGQMALSRKGPSVVPAILVQESMINSPGARLAYMYQFLGANYGVSSACASGSNAIIDVAKRIRNEGCEGALAVGADALELGVVVASFTNTGALAKWEGDPKNASRPWDKGRTGFVISEGAAALYLMPKWLAEEKNIPILAEIAGYGESADADKSSNLEPPSFRGPFLSMTRALEMAGLLDRQGGIAEIAYGNAHGTATPEGDLNEAKVFARAFGDYKGKIPVGSTKSIHGHMIGAAGTIEAIACILTLQKGVAPGNVNLDVIDPEIAKTGIYLPTQAVPMSGHQPRYAVNNSFGFGGTNATVIFKR